MVNECAIQRLPEVMNQNCTVKNSRAYGKIRGLKKGGSQDGTDSQMIRAPANVAFIPGTTQKDFSKDQ
jgi:hypothetical protein